MPELDATFLAQNYDALLNMLTKKLEEVKNWRYKKVYIQCLEELLSKYLADDVEAII
jgi:hypothetical protein